MKLKKGDIIVIILIICSIAGIFFFSNRKIASNSKYIRVTVDGKEVQKIHVDGKLKGKTIKIDTEHGYNLLELTEQGIKITESDCHDKICIHMGEISEVNDMIVCLPHKLVIEVKSDNENNELDAVIK